MAGKAGKVISTGAKVASKGGKFADIGKSASKIIKAACSFTANTEVATEQGQQPIGKLQVGDWVLAYDEASSTTGLYPITAVMVHQDPVIVRLLLDSELIETTPEHPFYTRGGEWVEAGKLEVGSQIREADDEYGTVQGVQLVRRTQEMYNLTVEQAHTFFVGDGQWLVHNSCSWITPGSLPKAEEGLVTNTMKQIEQAIKPPKGSTQGIRWGSTYGNYQNHLPTQPHGYYREYRVMGSPFGKAGVRRIVTGGRPASEWYYSWTHYGTSGWPPFVRIR